MAERLKGLTVRKPHPPLYGQAGSVYLLEGIDGYYKIGCSMHVRQRWVVLSRQCPFPVAIIFELPVQDMKRAENYLHATLAKYRAKGEWYKLPPEKVAWIMSLTEITPEMAA